MSQKYRVEFTERSIRKFKIKMKKLERKTQRFVDEDLIEFFEARFQSVFLKLLVREIIKLVGKLVIREAIVLGTGAVAGGTGVGAPAGAGIVIAGNVVIIVWTIVDAGLIIYNFRTVLRDKAEEVISAIKVQLEALKQVPEGVRKFSRAVGDRVKTDLGAVAQVPEGLREFGKAFKKRGNLNLGVGRVAKGEVEKEIKKRIPDFAFKAEAKVQGDDVIETLIDEWMAKGIRESYRRLIKEWARP